MAKERCMVDSKMKVLMVDDFDTMRGFLKSFS